MILSRPDIDLLDKFVRFNSKDTLNKIVSNILLKNFGSNLCFGSLELNYTGVTFNDAYSLGNVSQGTLATALSGSMQITLAKISMQYTLGYRSLFLNDDYEKYDDESLLRMEALDKFITAKYDEYRDVGEICFTKNTVTDSGNIPENMKIPFEGLIIIFNKNPMLKCIDVRNFKGDDEIDKDRERIIYSMDTSAFCFDEFDKGYVPIIIKEVYDKVILYQDSFEIISNKYREEYTDKEIRFAHDICKLHRAGRLGYRRFKIDEIKPPWNDVHNIIRGGKDESNC